MKGVPPEIDSLMWRLADEDSPQARAEFEARHTRYGPELARRIVMVNELRLAGKTTVSRPTFTPRPVRRAAAPAWTVGAAVALAGLAVGAVAYVTAPKPSALPKPQTVVVAPVRETPAYIPPQQRPLPKPEPMPNPTSVEKTPEPASVRAYDAPRDTRVAETSLTSAIELVATGGGLKATIAPGFPERQVTLDYRQLSTIDTLKAMGEEYGFSVLEEEEGVVLVVPARPATDERRRVGP